MKHTPGPWRIGDAGVTVFGPKTADPSPVTIADLRHGNRVAGEWRGNGRLIAAAPEMREHLRILAESELMSEIASVHPWLRARLMETRALLERIDGAK